MDFKTFPTINNPNIGIPTPKVGTPPHIEFAAQVFSQFEQFSPIDQTEILLALKSSLLDYFSREIECLSIRQREDQEQVQRIRLLAEKLTN